MLESVILEGRIVRLEPLEDHHTDALAVAGADERIWRYTPRKIRTRDDMVGYVADALAERRAGTMLPFVI
ncbi:MAG: hypothetical protein R3178_04670, partial [Rhodothermales bacterium]|nr:hypothetical protein [Rhodothermales bacterium]